MIPESLKALYELLKEANRIDLIEQITNLREELIEVREKNLKNKEVIENLQKQLTNKSKISFDKGICWLTDDELTTSHEKTAVCPQCWQVDSIINRLVVNNNANYVFIRCNKCEKTFEIK